VIKYTVSAEEKLNLQNVLLEVKTNPYNDYLEFKQSISGLIAEGLIPNDLHCFINDSRVHCQKQYPFVFIEGMPLDPILPYFSNEDPVREKRELKTTFVSEGILELFAQIRNEKPIGYLNVNDGDVFQDIFPKKDLFASQSQKALNEIYFQKDLANHFVRPDWVNLLCLRNDIENMITTCFTKNVDVLSAFSSEEKSELSKPQFHTPYDDLSTYKSQVELGEADMHPILTDENEVDIRFFENRTTSNTDVGLQLIKKVTTLLHEHKICVHLRPGDLFATQNNNSLHCKEIVSLKNHALAKKRWIMKTVNVNDYNRVSEYAVENKEYLIHG